jgi:hypothetical protein
VRTAAVDLSSLGAVSHAPPPPTPTGGAIDLSSLGAVSHALPPTPPAGTGPNGDQTGSLIDAPPMSWQGTKDVAKGVAKSAVQGANTIAGWLDSISAAGDRMLDRADAAMGNTHEGEPAAPGMHLRQTLESAENRVAPGITNPAHGEGQESGGMIEQLGEWMAGEGMLKSGITLAQRSTEIAKFATLLEKQPALARAVSTMMKSDAAAFAARQTAVGGGAATQTLLHGGTGTEAAESGILGAAGGAAVEGAGAVARGAARRIAAPAITADAVTDATRAAVRDRLEATNATRTPATHALPAKTGDFQFTLKGTGPEMRSEGSSVAEPRKKQIGTEYVAGKGSGTAPKVEPYAAGTFEHAETPALPPVPDQEPFATRGHKEPVFQYLAGTKPGTEDVGSETLGGGGNLVTGDVKTAAAHLADLQDAIDSPEFAQATPERKQQIVDAHDDTQRQIVDYYKQRRATGPQGSNFQPVDVQATLSRVGRPDEAAQELRNVGAEVYNHANDVTGGQFQALAGSKDGYIAKLYEKLSQEPYPAGRAQVRQEIARAEAALNGILEDPRNGIDATDAAAAKRNFHASYVLDDMHQAIKPLYGYEGDYRGFGNNRIGQRFDEFLKSNPDARQIIGGERIDTLKEIFQKADTAAGRKKLSRAVISIGSALTGHGVVTHGGQYVLDGMVSNPNVAKNLLFALDSGARPENYSPAIARMIEAGRKTVRAAVPVIGEHVVKAINDQSNEGEQQ